MGRRKKPGVPGKTTIPPEVVVSATRRLHAVFARRGDEDFELVVVPQQCFLYVEIAERREGRGAVKVKSSTTRTPLGRLRFVSAKEWIFERYVWTDEDWDTRDVERGTVDDLMLSMIVRKFCS